MKPGSTDRADKRVLAVYQHTHQKVTELATGLSLSVAELFDSARFASFIDAEYRAMLEAKLRAADPAFANQIADA